MSSIDPAFLEELLYRGESETLDFKRDQYPFVKASDREKSELLKDILAFSNAWRQEPAFILIGVAEAKGAKSTVVGVTHHLEDSDLQQFVNTKTQRPTEFSYQAAVLEGKDVGVIRIQVQPRPVYVLRKYGIVEKESVYLRRESSTAVATPDEVARMGAVHAPPPGQLELTWADLDTRRTLGSPLALSTVYYDPLLPDDAFDIAEPASSFLRAYSIERTNPHYSKKLVEFIFWRDFLAELGLCLKNNGDVVARRVRLVASIDRNDTWVRDSLPEPPRRKEWPGMNYTVPPLNRANEPDPCVQMLDDRWEVTVEFGDVRPHDEVWTTSPLFLGSVTGRRVALTGELRGDNLADPVGCRLEVDLDVESRPMETSDRQG